MQMHFPAETIIHVIIPYILPYCKNCKAISAKLFIKYFKLRGYRESIFHY